MSSTALSSSRCFSGLISRFNSFTDHVQQWWETLRGVTIWNLWIFRIAKIILPQDATPNIQSIGIKIWAGFCQYMHMDSMKIHNRLQRARGEHSRQRRLSTFRAIWGDPPLGPSIQGDQFILPAIPYAAMPYSRM